MQKVFITLLVLLCALFCHPLGAHAQRQSDKASVMGTVVDKRTLEALPYVQIVVKGTTMGTTSDAHGAFRIQGLPAGTYVLEARYVGYAPEEEHVTLSVGQRRHLDLYMQEQSLELDGLVVSASRQEIKKSLAPSLVSVLGHQALVHTQSDNLSQGLRFVPGLRIEDNCQNCGFNQVRINGLEGAYSQILIDSRPVFSALAGVYGLEQIPASMVERVEVLRGGGSALFGSNAIGGVINIITREPLRSEASVTQSLTSFDTPYNIDHGRVQLTTSYNATLVTDDRRGALTVYGQHGMRPGIDLDGDAFSEIPEVRGRSLGFRGYYKMGLYSKLTLDYRSMQEYRRGGDRLDDSPFQARIAEYLQHYIHGGSLRFDQGSRNDKYVLSAYASMQRVLRRSYYGGGDYADRLLGKIQSDPASDNAYSEVLSSLTSYGTSRGLDAQVGATYLYHFPHKIDLTVGLEGAYSSLDDQSGFRPSKVEQAVRTFSEFTQLEYKTGRWDILLGGRLDRVVLTQEGERSISPLLIVTPRLNIRYVPCRDLSLRASYSEGFRAPQFFDEELHVELAGGEPIARRLLADLREERSRSLSGSADWYTTLGRGWQLNLTGELFYTSISRQFIASPIEPVVGGRRIRTIVNNKHGHASVWGTTLEARLAYRRWLELQLGITLQRNLYATPKEFVASDAETGQEALSSRSYERTPHSYSYFTSTIRPTKHLSLHFSGTYTGSMQVPHEAYEGFDELGIGLGELDALGRFAVVREGELYRGVAPGHAYLHRSGAFWDIDCKASYELELTPTIRLALSAGVQNIFDSYQEDTDQGSGRASTYIYGPVLPRRYFVSATFSI